MSSISGVAPCAGAARGTGRPGATWTGWPRASCPDPGSPIPGPSNASASNTQGGSRMRESRPYGSVRGALSKARPYRDRVLGREREVILGGPEEGVDEQIVVAVETGVHESKFSDLDGKVPPSSTSVRQTDCLNAFRRSAPPKVSLPGHPQVGRSKIMSSSL